MKLTVVLADEHAVVRAGLRTWLEEAGIQVVGEADSGDAALNAVKRLRPGVLLIEANQPNCDGLECLNQLRSKADDTPVILYCGLDNPTYAARASALGATGFFTKSAPPETLIAAIRRAASGESCWTDTLNRVLNGGLATPAPEGVPGVSSSSPFTTREREVLKQLSFGLSNKEIAKAMGVSYETVKEHVQHILRKLAVSDRTQAAVWAVRNGMV